MPRPSGGEDDAPEAGISCVVVAVDGAEPNERILAGYDYNVGVCRAHRVNLHPMRMRLAFGAGQSNSTATEVCIRALPHGTCASGIIQVVELWLRTRRSRVGTASRDQE